MGYTIVQRARVVYFSERLEHLDPSTDATDVHRYGRAVLACLGRGVFAQGEVAGGAGDVGGVLNANASKRLGTISQNGRCGCLGVR